MNEVNFLIQFDLKHEAGHHFKLRYNWLVPQGAAYETKDTDTAQFKDLTLIRIEGEEPVPVAEPVVVEKGKKAPAPAKGAKNVEEILDNRPRTIQYTRDVSAESGGQGFKFTEGCAAKFANQLMTVQIMERDDKCVEKIVIDLSEMLWPENGSTVSLMGVFDV